MTDMIDDYRYLFALHLQDISKRFGLLYYDVLKGNMPDKVQEEYDEGLAKVFEYMKLCHGLEAEDVMAVHETVIETALVEFVLHTLHKATVEKQQVLH